MWHHGHRLASVGTVCPVQLSSLAFYAPSCQRCQPDGTTDCEVDGSPEAGTGTPMSRLLRWCIVLPPMLARDDLHPVWQTASDGSPAPPVRAHCHRRVKPTAAAGLDAYGLEAKRLFARYSYHAFKHHPTFVLHGFAAARWKLECRFIAVDALKIENAIRDRGKVRIRCWLNHLPSGHVLRVGRVRYAWLTCTGCSGQHQPWPRLTLTCPIIAAPGSADRGCAHQVGPSDRRSLCPSSRTDHPLAARRLRPADPYERQALGPLAKTPTVTASTRALRC